MYVYSVYCPSKIYHLIFIFSAFFVSKTRSVAEFIFRLVYFAVPYIHQGTIKSDTTFQRAVTHGAVSDSLRVTIQAGRWYTMGCFTALDQQRNCCFACIYPALQERHNGRHGVSDRQPHHCLLNRIFKAQIKENIKVPRHWPLWGEFTGDRWGIRTTDQFHHGHCYTAVCSP